MEKETLGSGSDGNDTSASHQALITQLWSHLAAIGWQGYQREGRGAVIIPADHLGDGRDATYVSDASLERLEQTTGSRWPTEEIARRVQSYDPKAEIVVVILGDDAMAAS